MNVDLLHNVTIDDAVPAIAARLGEGGQSLARPGDRLEYAQTLTVRRIRAIATNDVIHAADAAEAAVEASHRQIAADYLRNGFFEPERPFSAGDVARVHTGPGRVTALTATPTGWELVDLSLYTVLDHRDQEQAHLDSALALIRAAYPSATTAEFEVQTFEIDPIDLDRVGFTLYDVVLADGSRATRIDSIGFSDLRAATDDDLSGLEWDGVLREKRTGFASVTLAPLY